MEIPVIFSLTDSSKILLSSGRISYPSNSSLIEIDPNNHISLTENQVVVSKLEASETAYVYEDTLVEGDFKFFVDLDYFAVVDWGGDWIPWALWNTNGSLEDCLSDNGLYLRVDSYGKIWHQERYNGTTYGWNRTPGFPVYITVWRIDNTLWIYYYNDSTRVNPLPYRDSISLNENIDYNYLYYAQSIGSGSGSCNASSSNMIKKNPYFQWNTSFESGSLPGISTEITDPGTLEIQSTITHTGNYAAKITTSVGGPWGRVRMWPQGDIPEGLDRLNHRLYFYIDHYDGYIDMMVCYHTITSNNVNYIMHTIINSGGGVRLMRHYPDVAEYTYNANITTGRWYCLEHEIVVDPVYGSHRVWLDGVLILEETGVNNSGALNVGNQPKFGSVHYQQDAGEAVFYIDDVRIDGEYIGP